MFGFEGAHNPPYHFIRMVLRIPGDEKKTGHYDVISYKNHLPESEIIKQDESFSPYKDELIHFPHHLFAF